MMTVVIPGSINIDTGVVVPPKELELVFNERPPERDGYYVEEWVEETETQLIQHWEEVLRIRTEIEDKAEAYDILMGVES